MNVPQSIILNNNSHATLFWCYIHTTPQSPVTHMKFVIFSRTTTTTTDPHSTLTTKHPYIAARPPPKRALILRCSSLRSSFSASIFRRFSRRSSTLSSSRLSHSIS